MIKGRVESGSWEVTEETCILPLKLIVDRRCHYRPLSAAKPIYFLNIAHAIRSSAMQKKVGFIVSIETSQPYSLIINRIPLTPDTRLLSQQ